MDTNEERIRKSALISKEQFFYRIWPADQFLFKEIPDEGLNGGRVSS